MRMKSFWQQVIPWNKIKVKILVFGLSMSIIPFILLGILNIYSGQEKMEEFLQTKHSVIIQNSVEKLEMTIYHVLNQLKMLRDTGLVHHQNDDLYFLFGGFLKNVPMADSIIWINEDGEINFRLERRSVITAKNNNMINNQELLNTLAEGKDYLGDVQVSETGLTMQLAVPIHRVNQGNGGLIVNINLKSLFSKIVSKPIGENAYIYILDKDYRLIGHKDFSKVLYFDNHSEDSLYRNLFQKKDLTKNQPVFLQSYVSLEEKEVVGTIQTVPLTNWMVVLEQYERDAFQSGRQLVMNLTLYTLLTASVVSVISIIFALFFSKPIEKIEKGVKNVTEGDMNTEIDIQTSDEIGSLAHSFNSMMRKLKENSDRLIEEKKRLDTVVSGLGMGLILLDHDFKLRWVNKTIENWFGDPDYLIGKHCGQTIGRDCGFCESCPALTKEIVLEDSKEIVTTRVIRGKTRYFRHQVFVLHSSKQEHSSYLEVIEDITEKREMELMVHQADKLAAIGLLASGLAHEINNPLGVLSIYSEDLQDRLKEEDVNQLYQSGEIERYLETIQKQIDRCKTITQNLLNFSRKSTKELEPVSVHETINEVTVLLHHKIKKNHILLEQNFASKDPLVLAKSGEIHQVILNILTNAIDAVEGKQGVIQISTYDAKGKLYIEIKDNGIGITEEERKRVFEPFYTTKPPGKGTGLGLSVCYGLIKNLGGNIYLESTWKKGTLVRLEFPHWREGDKDESR
ncbi:ATP-binding protein [Microaerobacter geothermalis]|uniref:sensor histidine kinase n=1 Tax=Microaerobacter geothermalis TaxID=674972 RepID=UPI001F20DDFF|nr:PAS domain-containing sensor histidine kinase [Microaerobacter geothermalis]MCF6092479.1 ATP-binding protein [Microaerobacter geothermalis]